jgi:hypothetical protein
MVRANNRGMEDLEDLGIELDGFYRTRRDGNRNAMCYKVDGGGYCVLGR